MSLIQEELKSNMENIQKLIGMQMFNVGDANNFLKLYGNFLIKIDELEKSRDSWKAKYWELKNGTY